MAILILAAVAFGPELLGLSRPSQVAAYQTQEAQDAQYAAVQAQQQKTSEARNEAFAIWTDYVRMMNGFLDDWDAAYQRTTSSNRAEIGTQIDELIEIYEEINSTQIDPRFGRAHGTMLESLASAIQSFQTWQEGGSGHESMMDDYRSLRADWFDLVNQVEH